MQRNTISTLPSSKHIIRQLLSGDRHNRRSATASTAPILLLPWPLNMTHSRQQQRIRPLSSKQLQQPQRQIRMHP